ncbi:hypothetical protein, partial [Klebsiella pneumoniae]
MNLPSYSQFFHTIYDEKSPVGRIGRGTHYSVFETVQWLSPSLGRYKSPKVQKFAIIWDEDHDTRIVDVLEIALMRNLLGPVVFAGERKGSLNIVLSPDFDRLTPSEKKEYLANWQELADGGYASDSWGFDWSYLSSPATGSIIQDSKTKTEAYLFNICNLWELGHSVY